LGARITQPEAAVVVEVGWVNGLAALRSLGRGGVRTFAVDHRPWALGFKSRYAHRVIAPEPVADEDGFIAAMAALGRRFDGPTPVFATHDEHLNAMVKRSSELSPTYRFPAPGWPVLEALQRKRHQIETARQNDVGIPDTRYPKTAADAVEAADEMGYPVFLKPSDPVEFKRRFKRQAFECANAAQVAQHFDEMAEFEPMLQEFVPGGDDELYTLGSYLDADGEALGVFCGRKLRQTRENQGSARVGEAVWVDDVVESGLRLLRALDYTGVSQVEFKRDARTGTFKLMEVNPRLWQWHGLAAVCGVDLPMIAYLDLIGRPPAPVKMHGEGKRWSITMIAGTRNGFQRPPYTDAVWAKDDPRPAITQVGRVVTTAARKHPKTWIRKSQYVHRS
jgi:predicted ATP-grasp superfamily ATP-dependent carboligase